MDLSGRRTLGPVVFGYRFFKIMMSCLLMQFPVAPVSDFRVTTLMDLFNTACLYGINLGGNKVLYVDFNKIFLLLFVATFGTVPHRNSVHPLLLPYILISTMALYLCPGALELKFSPLCLPHPCVQQYLSKYEGIG